MSTTAPVALVTGGSRGLGRALAAGLLDQGWSVVTDARDADRLADTAATLIADHAAGDGERLVALAGDQGDATHLDALVGAAERLGGPDLVVLNAGDLGPSPLPSLADIDPLAFGAVLAANVTAPLRLVQRSLPALRRQHGTVVAITSDAAAEAYPGWGAYGASKAALEHVARVLAEEEDGITVHRIDPGDLRTDMHQAAFPGEDISDRPLPEVAVPGILAIVNDRRPSGQRWVAQKEVTP
ncbi:MAG TPA: SDR family oxidoreductase [Acidimicrobiales bacterium]